MANVWAKHDVKLNNLYSYLRKKERERGKERQRDACWTALNDFDWSSKLSTHLIFYLFAYRRVQLLMNLLLNAEYRSGVYAQVYTPWHMNLGQWLFWYMFVNPFFILYSIEMFTFYEFLRKNFPIRCWLYREIYRKKDLLLCCFRI